MRDILARDMGAKPLFQWKRITKDMDKNIT